jgi:4-amino-4-deoxy-L-arabinose transferase-like glycosyltransferase
MSEDIRVGPAEERARPVTRESWLRRHSDLFALAIVAIGFGIRIVAAQGKSLSGDEAAHFLVVNLPRALDVYRGNLSNAHPPLFFLLLHFWIRLGSSELFLRLLPVTLGGVFLWVAYRWALILLGRSAALMTLVLLSFSPALISLSAEVRDYTLLLLLMTASLLLLERAMEERSALRMAASSAFLSLAILTHYSAFFVVLVLFVYALVRLRRGRLPASVVTTWAACQVGVGVLCLWLATTHVADLRRSSLETIVRTRMLRAEYFQGDQDRLLDFLFRQTAAVFRYLSGSATAGAVSCALAVVGLVILALKRRPSALLLALPFLFDAGASLTDLYPYGGTRHSVFLLVFASAAIGVALSVLAAGRVWPAVVLVAVLAPVSLSAVLGAPERQSARRLKTAIEELRAAAPAGSLLFMDLEAGRVIDYYLERKAWTMPGTGLQGLWESSAGGYRIVGSPIWNATEYILGIELQRFVEVYRIPAGQVIWVVHVGPRFDLSSSVSRRFPGAVLKRVSRSDEMSFVEAVLP